MKKRFLFEENIPQENKPIQVCNSWMKIHNRLLIAIAVFCSFGLNACKDEPVPQPPKPEGDVFYIVGYYLGIADTANGIGKSEEYLFLSEKFKDSFHTMIPIEIGSPLTDILQTNTFPDTLFEFPSTIVYPRGIWCGFNIFPEEYRWKYKVRMTYTEAPEDYNWGFGCTPNQFIIFPFIYPKYMFIETISREED